MLCEVGLSMQVAVVNQMKEKSRGPSVLSSSA